MPERQLAQITRLLELSEQLLESELSPLQRNLATSIRATTSSLGLLLSDQQRAREEYAPSGPIEFDLQSLLDTILQQVGGNILHCKVETGQAMRRRGDPETLRVALRLLLTPTPGQEGHVLDLQVASGDSPEFVRFEVRGLGPTLDESAYRLIERMGGSFRSEGAMFAFEIPLPESEPGSSHALLFGSLQGAPIVLISVQPDRLRKVLQDCLACALGEEASNPRAILLDEAKTGPESAERVRRLQARWPGCPIAVVLEVATRGDADFYRNLGCQAFLARPFERAQLLETLGALLGTGAGEFVTSHRLRESALRAARILVVEDNPTTLMLTTKLVQRAGHQAIAASSGKEALELAVRERPDVILLDFSLGDMEGPEVARRLRALPEEVASTPIIAVTGHSKEKIHSAILEAGIDDYLSKPFRFEELSKKLSQWAGRRVHKTPTPVPPTPARPPSVDLETLRRAGMSDPEFEAELVASFLVESEGILGKMPGCLPGEVRKLAHSLKGSAAMLGAFALAELASRLENESDASQPSLIHDVEQEFRNVKSELNRKATQIQPPAPKNSLFIAESETKL